MTICNSVNNGTQCVPVGDVDGDGVRDYMANGQVEFGIKGNPWMTEYKRLTSVNKDGCTFSVGQKVLYAGEKHKIVDFKAVQSNIDGRKLALRAQLEQANPPSGKINFRFSVGTNELKTD